MLTQTVKIDAMAYLYDDCIQYLDNFYMKLFNAFNEYEPYKNMFDIEKTSEGIHLYSEIQNDIKWEVDDYGSYKGSGHYNGLMNQNDFIYYLNKFIKRIDTDHVFCELEDNSDFGDF